MDLHSDRVAESLSAFEPDPALVMSLADSDAVSELHRAINERRAQIENPEMLRRLRSL
jgi:hypothetical protein